MASRKPPLAEVRAAVKAVHRASPRTDRRYTQSKEAHTETGPYTMTWVVDPEDVAIVDAFLNGPMGNHQIVLQFRTLEQGWTAPKCDPNVSPEEAVMDDELARLRSEHADLIEGMKHVGPDAALA